MKKNMTVAVVVVSLVFASMLFVSAATNTLKVNVPFAFQVGKTTMPAGEYIVQIERTSNAAALGTMVVIRTLDGKTRQIFGSSPAAGATSGASLTFNRYANSYFLASVDSFDLGCRLYKSPAEKELASKANAHQVAVTAE